VFGNQADQPVVPFACGEMLVDDRSLDESKAARGYYVVCLNGFKIPACWHCPFLVACDHDFTHDGGSGARPPNDGPLLIDLEQHLVNRCIE
jgi:hypothetical protein